MGQPNPPGNAPLYEGLDSSWNDIVSAFPEDKRAELAPLLKARIDEYEPLKQWQDLQKSGITPDFAGTAISLFNTIENDPKSVYETIGKYLNITPAEAKEVVKEIQADETDDPRIARLEAQLDTLAKIELAKNQQSRESQLAKQAEEDIDKELGSLKKKYGDDIHEDEIIMRMVHKDMSAEEAYQDYNKFVTGIRTRRPAPVLLGNGGAVPSRAIDPRKLDSAQTKSLVAQMLESASNA